MSAKHRRRKGSVLLQTLVMSVVLSMIAVMVMRWVLSRYILSNRLQESQIKTGVAEGYGKMQISAYLPSNASTTFDQRDISFTMTSNGKTGISRYTITVSDKH